MLFLAPFIFLEEDRKAKRVLTKYLLIFPVYI